MMRLHGYLRGSATWRIRIALALKNRHQDTALVDTGPDRLTATSNGTVPVMHTDDGHTITQSLAIIEWLEERWPTPPLLPPDPAGRARVRGFAHTIACDIQPLQTEHALRRLINLGLAETQVRSWARQSLDEGLTACEGLLNSADGPFCFGAVPSLADLCLVPQLDLARRLGAQLTFPRLLAAEAACMTLPAFRDTRPLPFQESLYAP